MRIVVVFRRIRDDEYCIVWAARVNSLIVWEACNGPRGGTGMERPRRWADALAEVPVQREERHLGAEILIVCHMTRHDLRGSNHLCADRLCRNK